MRKHLICHYLYFRSLKLVDSWCREDDSFVSFHLPVIVLSVVQYFPLRSIVVDHLERSFSNNHDIAIIFAYCRYTDRYSVTDILASFVKQLVERHSGLISVAEFVYMNHRRDATRPHERELLELLRTFIPLFNRVYIIIDAMDEFPDDTKDGFLMTLMSLQASLLVTSRSSHWLHLHDIQYIDIEAENQKDIRLFIDKKIQESSKLTLLLRGKEHVKQQIGEKLQETSKSMYVTCLFQNRCTMTDISNQVFDGCPANRILEKQHDSQ